MVTHPGLPQIRTCGFPASGSSGTWLRCTTEDRVDDLRARQGITSQQPIESTPRHVVPTRAPVEPLLPGAENNAAKGGQAPKVSSDAVVPPVSAQLQRQSSVLLGDRQMAMSTQPIVDRTYGPSKPARGRLSEQGPSSPASHPPLVGESQQVECARTLVAQSLRVPATARTPPIRRLRKTHETRLLRV